MVQVKVLKVRLMMSRHREKSTVGGRSVKTTAVLEHEDHGNKHSCVGAEALREGATLIGYRQGPQVSSFFELSVVSTLIPKLPFKLFSTTSSRHRHAPISLSIY